MKRNWAVILAAAISISGLAIIILFWHYQSAKIPTAPKNVPRAEVTSVPTDNAPSSSDKYPLHQNITVTTFWIGEDASGSNAFISNAKSAWDENWQVHYGGVDDPKNRNGFYPAAFIPEENPFYFALPYNDFDAGGNRKPDVNKIVYWAADGTWDASQSMLKNQWIKITKNGTAVYAQWEDVGPFGENDSDYVFGNSTPQSSSNNNAGLDVSPAIETYLNLSGEDTVSWQFIKAADVPSGPWKDIVTTS
ncbi:MAG: hypothetical protein WC022_02975 [Parcubacteria group bacterium]